MVNGRLYHRPVLLDEVLCALALRSDGVYVDGTFGRGGHSVAILKRLEAAGRLLVFDKDPTAIAVARDRLQADPRVIITQGSYTLLEATVRDLELIGKVRGVLLDLGVSSPQFDDASRGFSFQRDGELDMRMDNTCGETAATWLQRATCGEIATALYEFGEERFSRRIARAIVRRRASAPIMSTVELAELVASTVPPRRSGKHPATRTFQALRMVVNRELEELHMVLVQAVKVLAEGGRLLVISFHSLEDRAVKRFMRDASRGVVLPKAVPVMGTDSRPTLRVTGKCVRPSRREITENPRARSAVLRIAERLAA